MASQNSWQSQLERLIDRKNEQESAYRQVMKMRSAPCNNFSGYQGTCHLGLEIDCLNCTRYEPWEPPGPLDEDISMCEYETGRVYHLMEYAESDGYYRRGRTICGRYVDEKTDEVVIYEGIDSERKFCEYCKDKRTIGSKKKDT
jgi:hypothetical protein